MPDIWDFAVSLQVYERHSSLPFTLRWRGRPILLAPATNIPALCSSNQAAHHTIVLYEAIEPTKPILEPINK